MKTRNNNYDQQQPQPASTEEEHRVHDGPNRSDDNDDHDATNDDNSSTNDYYDDAANQFGLSPMNSRVEGGDKRREHQDSTISVLRYEPDIKSNE